MLREVIVYTYFTLLVILSLYGAHRYHMIYLFLKYRKNRRREPETRFDVLPKVTIQLPVFNELYVVERLIDAVVRIRYPKDRLQIQVLDDSTDETVDICRNKVDEYKKQGYDIECLHRVDRTGFKAGAMDCAMSEATGEFIAIFDADFMPKPDFLEKTIHYFSKFHIIQNVICSIFFLVCCNKALYSFFF